MRKIDATGEVALVTGGSKGIGAEIFRELAACGAEVFINYFSNKEAAEIIAREIQEKYKVKAYVGGADVSKSDQVHTMFMKWMSN